MLYYFLIANSRHRVLFSRSVSGEDQHEMLCKKVLSLLSAPVFESHPRITFTAVHHNVHVDFVGGQRFCMCVTDKTGFLDCYRFLNRARTIFEERRRKYAKTIFGLMKKVNELDSSDDADDAQLLSEFEIDPEPLIRSVQELAERNLTYAEEVGRVSSDTLSSDFVGSFEQDARFYSRSRLWQTFRIILIILIVIVLIGLLIGVIFCKPFPPFQ